MRGEQAIFNLEIKKKRGLSINSDIHHSKVPSSDFKMFQMTVWSFGFNGMLVPIGSKTGVGYINGFHPLGFMVRQLKSEDLFTKRYWGDLGVKMPA